MILHAGQAMLVHGDNVATMRLLEPDSIHLVVTSPPYDDMRKYSGEGWDFEATAMELTRVLAPGGVICWNVGDQTVDGSETLSSHHHAQYFKDWCGLRVHDTMIYNKLNFSAPERVRYHQMWEHIFVFSKGAPRCFNPLKDKPNVYAGRGTFGKNTKRHTDGTMVESVRNTIAEYGMRGNVWTGKTAGQERPCQALHHPARMPEWLARDLVLSWSNAGDVVLDPFAGEFTTALACNSTGRSSIGVDNVLGYVEAGHRRLEAALT